MSCGIEAMVTGSSSEAQPTRRPAAATARLLPLSAKVSVTFFDSPSQTSKPRIHSRPDQAAPRRGRQAKSRPASRAAPRRCLADFVARREMTADGEIGGRPDQNELPVHARLDMAPTIGAPQIRVAAMANSPTGMIRRSRKV